MKFKELLRQFIKSVNPSKYHHVSEKQLGHSFELFFGIFFLSFIIMAVLFVPVVSSFSDSLADSIDDLSVASINITVESEDPVVILSSPQVVIDSNATGIGSARLLFAEDQYYYNLFGEHNVSYSFESNLQDSDNSSFKLLAFLLMPGVFLFMGLGFIFSLLFFLLLVSLISLFFVKDNLTFRDVLVIAIHASLLPMALFLISLAFINLFLVSLALFLLLFILGLIQAFNGRSRSDSLLSSSDGNYGAFENQTTIAKRKKSKSSSKKVKSVKDVFEGVVPSSKKPKRPRQVEIWD